MAKKNTPDSYDITSITVIEDQGCYWSPKCLECPMVVCKEDDPGLYKKFENLLDKMPLIIMIRDGYSRREIQEKTGLSESSIDKARYKYLAGRYDAFTLPAPPEVLLSQLFTDSRQGDPI